MAKHKKKRKVEQEPENNFDLNNINLQQVASLLNGMDTSKLNGLLNNIDLNQIGSLFNNMNLNELTSAINSPDKSEGGKQPKSRFDGDKRVELLRNIKPMLDDDKGRLVDAIAQLYIISKILKK